MLPKCGQAKLAPLAMTELQQETTLEKVRSHWGIFIPVLLGALGPITAALPALFIIHGMFDALHRLGMPVDPRLNLIWLLFLIPYFAVVAGLFLGSWFTYLKSEITLTDRRLVFRTGFLSRRSGELPLENVESIYISESVLGRLCGWGTVTVTSLGGGCFPLSFIGSAQNFHSTLQKAVLDTKNRIGRTSKPSGVPPLQQDGDERYKPKL